MALETGTVVNDLVTTNPTASDAKSQGDDHLRLIKAAVKNSFPGFTGAVIVGGTSTGAVNAYVLSAAMQSYVANTLVVWTPSITNTDATTININGLGTVAIKRVDGAPTLLNDLIAGQYAVMAYTGTEFRIVGVTKSYIDSLSFSSSLPAQTGSAGKVITTDGTTASWTNTLTLAGLDLVSPLAVAQGGTSSNNATSARTALSAAKLGANADITALSGLTTPLSVAQGGTGTTLITGTGSTVHSASPTLSSPTLITPALGTPSSGNLTDCSFPTLNQNTTGNAATATLAEKSSTLANGGGNGGALTFTWTDTGEQPSYLWGSVDGSNMKVYPPSRLSVDYANSAGSATNATNGRYVYDNGAWSGTADYREASNMHVYKSRYATYATNAGYADSAGSAPANGGTATYANGSQQSSFVLSGTTGDGALIITNARTAAGSCYIDMHAGLAGANRLRMLKQTGNFLVTNDSASGVYLAVGGTGWNTPSDERLKNIDRSITDAISKVSSLRTVIGSYKTDEVGKERVFVIAQDVEKVLPQAINIDDDGMLGVAYTDLIPLLIAAIKEQQVQIDQLKTLAGI